MKNLRTILVFIFIVTLLIILLYFSLNIHHRLNWILSVTNIVSMIALFILNSYEKDNTEI